MGKSQTQIMVGLMLIATAIYGWSTGFQLFLPTENPAVVTVPDMTVLWMVLATIGSVIVLFNVFDDDYAWSSYNRERRRRQRKSTKPVFTPPPSVPVEQTEDDVEVQHWEGGLKAASSLKALDTPGETDVGFNPTEKKPIKYEARLSKTGVVECPGCGYFTEVKGWWDAVTCEGCGERLHVKRS